MAWRRRRHRRRFRYGLALSMESSQSPPSFIAINTELACYLKLTTVRRLMSFRIYPAIGELRLTVTARSLRLTFGLLELQQGGTRHRLLRRCAGCLVCESAEVKLSWCAGCRDQYYCSRHCQKRMWPEHKKLCQQSAAIRLKTGGDEVAWYMVCPVGACARPER